MTTSKPYSSGLLNGLSTRLMATIILVIMLVEVVIYLPSVANFRANWLEDKVAVGLVAARVLDVVPEAMDLPDELKDRLLSAAGAAAIAYRHAGQSELIERTDKPMPKIVVTADLRSADALSMIIGALDALFNGPDRTLRIVGQVPGDEGAIVEILIAERPLWEGMILYSRNIFILSLIVAAMAAFGIFIFMNRSMILPIQAIAANMVAFRQAPENGTLIKLPSSRKDEIGILERELFSMERDLFSMLRQQRHLADLGLAVAKINHDLRNTLTSAQLLSDQVATLDDPKVQRLAPRLVTTLDRAIGFAQNVLDYGRQSTTPPKPQPVDLRALIEETCFDAGLVSHPTIEVRNEIPDAVSLLLDPDQMARVFHNLLKNAREALEVKESQNGGHVVRIVYEDTTIGPVISFNDNGPGLPPRARDNLFVAFEGSARAGGTGLGLAIAREITEAHGGDVKYVPLDPGTCFEISLPANARLNQMK